jgi:hypothetical protein
MARSSAVVADAISWGHASGPTGLAPEALQERGCSCKGFYKDLLACGVLVSTGIGNIPAGPGSAARTYPASSAFGAPEPGPVRSDRGELFDLV